MPPRIRVTVVKKSQRRHFQLRYRDSLTKQEMTRSAGTAIRREAERAAARWEQELQTSRHVNPDEVGWADFLDKYRTQHLQSLADNSEKRAMLTLDCFTELIKPFRLSEVSAGHISRFQALRREAGIAETTISTDLRNLRGALRWGYDVDLLREVPKFPRTQRAKTGKKAKVMKGRPISEEEFQKMLAAIPLVVGSERVAAWTHYLNGLWLSGLRLTESLELFWDRDDRLSIDFTHDRPMFRIAGDFEKGNRDRFLALSPEFAEFLEKIPAENRMGRVFVLPRDRQRGERMSHWRVSEIISEIGKKSGVIVESKGPKYASAHDLRRSFGQRWASRVLPQVLQNLMRHENIETTMKFYVQADAQAAAEIIWEAHNKLKKGNTKGNAKKKR